MSMEDPFFVVKGEVQKAVNTAQGLFQRWTELLQDPSIATREEIDWTTNELRNNLRSIEWDLEDLDETISIVEANPRKFNLDATELGIRKAFITSTRQVVREMKDQMSNSSMQALAERKNRQALLGESGSQSWSSGPDKYSRLDRELQLANSHFIEEQQAQQQLIVEQQDEQLELVSGSIGVLKNMSQRIGGELEEQAVSTAVVCNYRPLHHLAGEIPSKKTRTQLLPFSSEDRGSASVSPGPGERGRGTGAASSPGAVRSGPGLQVWTLAAGGGLDPCASTPCRAPRFFRLRCKKYAVSPFRGWLSQCLCSSLGFIPLREQVPGSVSPSREQGSLLAGVCTPLIPVLLSAWLCLLRE
ncbi:syntaxin-6 isoform X2 [Falco naumanni]|uniref:syntaxin-6 isoform X2 n=1 Tax=Falco naumanni TaxID=148594 RepID=UPI001ADE8137|nr:syntaxin-6 isoform X2 [Falco naumanni]